MFYQADAYGRSGWAGVRTALKRHGERIAVEATYRRGAKFTGTMRKQVEILQAADPDAVICIGAYAACAAFARDAVDLGLRVPIANLSFVGSENLLKLLTEGREDSRQYTDLLVNSQVVPSYEAVSIVAVQEYRELMRRYDPKVPAELVTEAYTPFPHSFVSLEGFLDAKLMVEVLRRLGDAPSREHLSSAVFTIKDYDLGIEERRVVRSRSPTGTTEGLLHRRRRRAFRALARLAWAVRLSEEAAIVNIADIKVQKLFQKTLFGVLCLFGIIGLSTSILLIYTVDTYLSEEYEDNSKDIAKTIADSSVDILLNRDLAVLQSLIDQFVRNPGHQIHIHHR